MVKKKVPYAELKIFSAYTLVRTRLYDSAASTASPLGSAVSLAMIENFLYKKIVLFQCPLIARLWDVSITAIFFPDVGCHVI